jgi:WD40 repeat protein
MKAGNPYLLMFDVESGELVKRIDMPATSDPNYGIHWLQMHPTRNQVYVTVNSDFLASGDLLGISGDRFAPYLVDLDTGEIQRIENDFLPYNAEFTPDGTQLVFSSFSDNRVRIYDIETRRFVREWVSDQAGISALSVSPDGRTVITPSSILASDPIVNLWDFESGELIRRFTGHDPETFLIGTEFQPDGQRFLSAAIDGTVRVWTFNHQLALDWIRENRYIRDLTCAEREIYRVEPLCDQ